MKFKLHSTLMSHLLVAEKDQQFLLKVAESKPVEAHAVELATRKPKGRGGMKQSHKANQGRTSRSSKDKPDKPYSKKEKSDKGEKNDKSRESRETCTCFKCRKPRHITLDCGTYEYFCNMYQKLKKLEVAQKETHTLDAPSLDTVDPENFMVSKSSRACENIALLDSATTHAILRDPGHFLFSSSTAGA